MKDIKEYIHYYEGCQFEITEIDPKYFAEGLIGHTIIIDHGHVNLIRKGILKGNLHLRDLDDLAEEEMKEFLILAGLKDADTYSFHYTTYSDEGFNTGEMKPAIYCTKFGNLQWNPDKLIALDKFSPAQFHYLLSKKIRLFNIEN